MGDLNAEADEVGGPRRRRASPWHVPAHMKAAIPNPAIAVRLGVARCRAQASLPARVDDVEGEKLDQACCDAVHSFASHAPAARPPRLTRKMFTPDCPFLRSHSDCSSKRGVVKHTIDYILVSEKWTLRHFLLEPEVCRARPLRACPTRLASPPSIPHPPL